jgi:hypothetical protein
LAAGAARCRVNAPFQTTNSMVQSIEKHPLMIRCLILLPLLAAATVNAGPAWAQGPSNSQACFQAFTPLREEAEGRARLVKAASERHASREEGCRLIGEFAQSEIRMIKYLEANSVACAAPKRIAAELKASHQHTEAVRIKVCAAGPQKPGSADGFDGVGSISLRPEPAQSRGPVGDFDKVR